MVETTETVHARLEAVHAELMLVKRELAEREQELGCMYAALNSGDLGSDDAPLEAVLQQIGDLVSLAFLEQRIGARIVVTNQQFATEGFCETPFRYTQSIMVDGQEVGVIEVHRNGSTTDVAPMPPSKERFLANLAIRVGEIIRRRSSARRLQETDETLQTTNADLEDKLRLIEIQSSIIDRLQDAMKDLASPVLEVWQGVLVVPIVGGIHEDLGITDKVLAAIAEKQPHFVIVDMTGVPIVSTESFDLIFRMLQAASLLGTDCILTGIQPHNAETMVQLGFDTSRLNAHRTLRDGLQACLRKMHIG